MKEAAHRALEIDATTAEAYTVLVAAATFYDRDWIRADEGFRRALELNPNSAIAHDRYGAVYLRPMGRHDEAIAHGKRAKELDPLTPTSGSISALHTTSPAATMKRSRNASRSMDIDPNFYFTYWCLGYAYWQKGMLEEAMAAYQHGVDAEPRRFAGESPPRDGLCRYGDKARAQTDLEEFKEKARREYVPPVALAGADMAVATWRCVRVDGRDVRAARIRE